MHANKKRQRSDSVAVTTTNFSKKAKQNSPENDGGASAPKVDDKDVGVIPEGKEGGDNTCAFVYNTPKVDALSSSVHFLFYSFELEERHVEKAWPRAAVREVYARIASLPEDEQEDRLNDLECINTFPLVQVGHCDADLVEGEGGKMYDVAIEAMTGPGWQDVVLQKEKPSGDVPSIELELDGETESIEDWGRPYHGRWWWVASRPASAEDEQAIEKLSDAGLGERTALWAPKGELEVDEDEGGNGSEEEDSRSA